MEAPTLEGKIKLKIPAGTQGGRSFRLRNKGIAHLHDYGRGDQLVKVQIDVPSNTTLDQKRLLRELAKASERNPGPLAQTFMEKMKKLFR